MGSSYYVYVGPYLRCRNPERSIDFEVRGCTNEACAAHGKRLHDADAKFCTKCGHAIGQVVVSRKRQGVNAYEVSEEIKERLSVYNAEHAKEDEDYWVGNIDWKAGRKLSWDKHDEDSCSVVPIGAEIPADEVKDFADYFAEEIKVIKARYGEDNVQLGWGVMAEFM